MVEPPQVPATAPRPELTLLHDGHCPFCQREVAFLARRDRAGRLAFVDIAAPGFDPAVYGTTLPELQAVLHGVLADGTLVRRVDVFRAAYRAVGLGWLVAPTTWPGLRWLVDRGYTLFARHRVRLGRLFGRTCDDGACELPAASAPVDPPSHTPDPPRS